MPVSDPVTARTSQARSAAGARTAIASCSAILLAALAASALTLPLQLVLPVLCLVALLLAAAMAWIAWRSRAGGLHPNYWDIAAALVLIGCGAAIFSKPENVLLAFAGATAG